MSLVGLIVVLVIVGVVLWAINQFIPMDTKVKAIMNVVVVIVLLLWLLNVFGLLHGTLVIPKA
jgi:hypothetical protein